MDFYREYFKNIENVINNLNFKEFNKAVNILKNLQNNKSRLFICGVGGSAGNASHATNDFRKLCNINTLCPTDNVSEITARTNDEGFETIFEEYMKTSNLNSKDAIMIFSVGGGNLKKKVSMGLINSIKYAKKKKAKIISIIGRNDGYAFKNSNSTIHIKVKNQKLLTPISEAYQSIIWHLFVSHPLLQKNKTKW